MTETNETRSRPMEEENPPAQGGPLIVIEYRHRGLSWALLVPLLLLACTGAVLVYHRLVAERYRREAAHARADYESLQASQAAAARPAVVPTPIPLAENSMPVSDQAKSTLHATPKTPPKEAPPAEPVTVVITPSPVATTTPEPSAAKPEPLSPLAKALARPIEIAAATPPTVEPPKAAAPDPEAPLAPLPTKEESLRQIKAESEALKAKIAQGWQERHLTDHEAFLTEQSRFRDDLRDALRSDPKKIGAQIDSLAKRYNYGVDPKLQGLAQAIWGSRLTIKEKIARIRALALPETVILNLLSDDLHLRVHTRDGPRDENEVRRRAARILLSHELPSKHASASSSARPGAPQPASGSAPRVPARPVGGS